MGPPSSLGPLMVPAKGGPKTFKLKILLAPKQKSWLQPQTLEGEERGGGPGGANPPFVRCTSLGGGGGMLHAPQEIGGVH